jgi:hypothetical protein
MSGADYTKHTDKELIDNAESGLRGQGAVIEALRRHREATARLERRMWSLEIVAVIVAVVGVILAGVQVWVALK